MDLGELGIVVAWAALERPAGHLGPLLKLYIYMATLSRVASSGRLQRERGVS